MSKTVMELQDGIHNVLGGYRMEQSKADFIREEVIPKAKTTDVPMLDIYAEILTVHDEIQLLGVTLNDRLNRLEEFLMTPWYRRWWRAIWQYITSR